jgi:hypothetical protein
LLKEEIEMRTYIGTKIIEAVPTIRMGGKVCEEGYKVRYQDGYESFSPKAVFEAAYRPIDSMNFGLAIEAMKKGKKCRRAGWNGKNQHIELASAISYTSPEGTIVNANHEAIGNKAIAFCGTSGVQMGWLASQADMLADDWEIVE